MKKIICLVIVIFLLTVNGYATDDIKSGWNDVTQNRHIKACVSSLMSQIRLKIKSEHEGEVLPGDERNMEETLDEASNTITSYCECLMNNISTKWSLKTYAKVSKEEKGMFFKDLYCSGSCTLDADVELMKCD